MHDNNSRRSNFVRLGVLVLILLSLCGSVSFLTARWVMHGSRWQHDQPHGHHWLSDELGLTEVEAAAIDLFEDDYRSRRAELLELFNQRIRELGDLIRTNDRFTPEVSHAIHRLHEVHGELQNLSVAHYYDMLGVLPPEKQKSLQDLAVEALSVPE